MPTLTPTPRFAFPRKEKARHFVQFYQDDQVLVESVGAYFLEGFGRGEGAILIATRAHREAIEGWLRNAGQDLEAMKRKGLWEILDARETLDRILVEGSPDDKLFHQLIGEPVSRMTAEGAGLRAFGEMVALLWAEGREAGAVRLEKLWNDLGKVHAFSLCCAYPMEAFAHEGDGTGFSHVCHEHSSVIPAEAVPEAVLMEEGGLRAIAHLQQKTMVLEKEIAKRKAIETELRISQQKLSNYLETATIGLHWVGQDGTILWANAADYGMLGYTREEYVGRNIMEFHADQEVIEDILSRLQRDEKLRNIEARLKAKDGSIRTVLIDSSVMWKDGKFLHTQCFTRDISNLRRAEELLHQSQKMEAIGRLAGGIAHDFNNLLTAIIGYTDMAEALEAGDEALPGFLSEIKRSGERAAALTQQLLAYSRRQIITPKLFDLNGVVTDMDRMLRRVIREDIDFRVVLAPQLPLIKADPGQIEQVILNIVLNARDAMPNGGRLELETRAAVVSRESLPADMDAYPGPCVQLIVRDTGIGMSKEIKSRIFEPFFTTKEVGKGTGLGLASAYGIIKQSGGGISVESEPGKGTAFCVWLPVAQAGAKAEAPAKPEAYLTSGGTRATILVAEDEEAVRKLISISLTSQGFTVLEAPDGEEALALTSRHSVDLLVTDVIMPRLNGGELADRLKESLPNLKTLFISGYTKNILQSDKFRNPASDFMQKPFTPKELIHRVVELLERGARATALP